MSKKLLERALKQRKLSPREHLVLRYLAWRADDEGWAWPSMRTIANACDCSVRTAQRCVAALEKKKRIHVERWSREDGSQSSNNILVLRNPASAPACLRAEQKLRGRRTPAEPSVLSCQAPLQITPEQQARASVEMGRLKHTLGHGRS